MGRQNKKKLFRKKGDYGYMKSEKIRRFLVTAGLFVLPVGVLIAGWLYYGSRNNVLTVIAVVGALPGCRSIVNLIMILRCPSMDQEVYQQIYRHSKGLTMAYELYITFYEKNAFIDAAAFCGNLVVCYSSDYGIDGRFISENIEEMLKKNGYKVNVTIAKDLNAYLGRLDAMREKRRELEKGINFKPDPRYPGLSRNEMIKHTFMALCL